jgi:ankyrin repeat protein
MGTGASSNALRMIVGFRTKQPLDERLRNACFFGQKDIIDELLPQVPRGPGGPVDGEDPIGYTPIMYASGSGYPEILEALLQHGATLHHKAQNGYTAVHKAAECGKMRCLAVLIVWRADLNAQSLEGLTPAMIACIEKKDFFLKMLIDHKVDLALKDLNGNTCMDHAKHPGAIDLLEAGLRRRDETEAKRRDQLVQKKASLEVMILDAKRKEQEAKKKKLEAEAEALKAAHEEHLREMAERARRDNDESEAALREKDRLEREEAEMREQRIKQIHKNREIECSVHSVSVGTLCALLAIKNQYVLSMLLESSRAVGKAKQEDQEYHISHMHTLTARKKLITDEMIRLNSTADVPSEFVFTGRHSGVLGQIGWLIAKVSEETRDQNNSLFSELREIEQYFKTNDSAEGQLRRQGEIESFRAQEILNEETEIRRREEEHRLAQIAENERKERWTASLRLAVCKETGLSLPLLTAWISLSNAVTLRLLMKSNELIERDGTDEELLIAVRKLALDKKMFSQQTRDLGLSHSMVPKEYAELAQSGKNCPEHVALSSQLDWLALQIQLLQNDDSETASEGDEEEKFERETCAISLCHWLEDQCPVVSSPLGSRAFRLGRIQGLLSTMKNQLAKCSTSAPIGTESSLRLPEQT